MKSSEVALAHLAVEYWKLVRTLERAVSLTPESDRERLASQARYAVARFETILAEQNMSIREFDGLDFAVNLPVSPVNGNDFQGSCDGELVIERTIEPTVLSDMRVIVAGKVLLAKKG
jgi:hypothetical protein